MSTVQTGNDPAMSTALPVRVPGQQVGSIAIIPQSSGRPVQLAVITAARQQVQKTGSYTVPTDPNPLYNNNGICNGYQETKYTPGGKPVPGTIGRSTTNRSTIQGYPFVPLNNPSVFGGSISDNVPPPAANSYSNRV